MAIHLASASPQELLSSIRAEVSLSRRASWRVDEEGDFRALGLRKSRAGWFRPRAEGSELVFDLLPPQAVALSAPDYQAHHARLVALIMEKFPDLAPSMRVTNEDASGGAGFKTVKSAFWDHRFARAFASRWQVLKAFLADEERKFAAFFREEKLNLKFATSALSVLSVAAFVVTYLLAMLGATRFLVVAPLLFSIVTGLMVLGTTLEATVGKLASLGSARILWIAFLGVAGYVAHGYAADDVNRIFHIDASALPHATAAATAFQLLRWAFWPLMIFVVPISFAVLCRYASRERRGGVFPSLSVLLSSLFFALITGLIVLPEAARQSVIYQIARQMDFDDSNRCVKLPVGDKSSMLFIGPDQSRALVAPEIQIAKGSTGVVPKAIVPPDFAIVECDRSYSPPSDSPSKKQ